jgi:serine/threonine protein kinase
MLLENHTPIRTTSGKTYHTEKLLGVGGQAQVYLLQGGNFVFKRFTEDSLADDMTRVRWLLTQKFPKDLPLALPSDLVEQRDLRGYIAPFIKGESVAALSERNPSYEQGVQIAAGILSSLAEIHAYMTHGDVRAENILVTTDKVIFIDPDNYVAKGAPVQNCLGDLAVMAPEIRSSMDPRLVSTSSDVYAAAHLVHRFLMLRDDTSFAQDGDEMFAALAAGRWHSDTFGGKGRRDDGIEGKGFRAEMLDSVTASLFRAAFSADPKLRPTAAEFADHLNSILRNGRITFCPACRWPIIMELGRTHCVHSHHCGKPLPLPLVLLPNGKTVPLDQPLVIGREHVGQERVSSRHVMLTRAGNLVVARDLKSTNGSEMYVDGHWSVMSPSTDVYLEPHPTAPVLRLAGKVDLKLIYG